MSSTLGVSTAELCRWKRLAEIPEPEFEARLANQLRLLGGGEITRVGASSILRNEPVPARGRVERAQSLVRSMTQNERAQFLSWLGESTNARWAARVLRRG
jgi:hypothetical protein